MLEAVIVIAATAITWWLKRRIKRLEDENAEYLNALCEIDLAVTTGNQDRVNARLESTLRRLHGDKGDGDTKRQGGTPDGTE